LLNVFVLSINNKQQFFGKSLGDKMRITGEGGEGRPGHPEGLMKRWRKLKRGGKTPSVTCE
jgi:hypothetical protein